MTGGSATHAGIGFQDKVAGMLAVHILADAPVDFFGLPANVTPTSIELETSAPVDDILMSTSSGGLCFINVKKSVTLSRNPDSALGSVLDQFVRLWIACNSGRTGRSWQRPLESNRDRLVLVTGGNRALKLADALSKVIGRVADRRSIAPREGVAATAPERVAYDTVLELLRLSVRRHTGDEPSDELIASLLGMTRVAVVDPDSTSKTNVLALLKTVVIAEPTDAEAAWLELVAECQRLSETRSGADRAGLRNALRSRGIRLAGAPEIAADARRLEDFTRDTLSSLSHLAHLDVPTGSATESIEIERAVTHALVEHAKHSSLLVIGAPGSGKSGAMYLAATRLMAEGHPVVAIAVDRHPVHSPDDLRRNIGLDRPVIEVLRNWSSDKKGILLIDALDAARGGPSDRVFQELIRRVLQAAPNWRVVASIRVFDLRFGVIYRDLFAGRPPDDAYRDSDFKNVRHLLLPQLTERELDQVWLKSPLMGDAHSQGTPALRDLLHSPFNLFLLANVLAAGVRDLRDVTTQVQLLHHYWSYRVTGNDQRGFAREGLLRKALERMLEERTLQVALRDVPEARTEDLYRLHSEGVLSPTEGVQDSLARISFAHHVLFDYGVARLILESGRAPDFAARLTSSDERALLIAPGAMMALQILWQDDGPRRRTFWKKAFEVAGSDGTGAFCRMLPARTAATLIGDVEDLEPVLDCLRRPDCPDRTAAVFLMRHCTGALAAGVAPKPTSASPRGAWPWIAHALAEASVNDIGWMLKPLVGQWVEAPTILTTDETAEIGSTARLMLRYGSGEPYDSSMVIVGLQGVARTFASAPAESVDSLSQLLSLDHVSAHGHEELSWLAREFKHLLVHIPASSGVIRDTYRAGYCTPLPSRDEKTNVSRSRILSLTSNRLQDFEHAQWELFEQFPRFFDADPENATDALIEILTCYTEEHRVDEEEIISLVFGDLPARYQADNSYVWLRGHDDHKKPPVHAFESGLVSLVDSGRLEALSKVLGVVIRRNHLASIWASLLSAGAERPDALGRLVLPLLTARPVLDGLDTRKPAGDLIAALHPLLSEADRIAIETAILDTGKYAQPVLLGCLDEQHIASQEAHDRRREFEKKRLLPKNREPFEITVGPRALDDDWWLRQQGVNLSTEANAALNKAIKAVEGMKRPEGDDAQKRAFLVGRWKDVQVVHEILQSRRDIPEALLMSAWNAVADVAGTAAEVSNTADDLVGFPGLAEIIVGALDAALRPLPVADPEREAAFAKMPGWSSPAPRVEAAGALMALVRAQGHPDPNLTQLIESLAKDPSAAVRHQILGRTNMLFDADRPLMWKLCEIGFTDEKNEGVISFFLPAVAYVLRERPQWFTEQLLALDERVGGQPRVEGSRDEFVAHLVQLLLQLWFVYDQAAAGDRVRTWTNDPVAHAKRVQDALSALRGAMLQGDPARPNPNDDRVRARTIEIFERTVQKVGPLFTGLAERRDLTESERATAETALHILDQAASQIYFSSGACGTRNRQDNEENPVAGTPEVRARFLREMAPTLSALAQVPYPSVTHHLLETLEAFIPDDPLVIFRLVTEVLVSGGRAGGYHLESLGSHLFVRIVRRYLADFRAVIASDDDLRHRLMRALDVFVEAGWPEARRLVYDLPEMLR